MANIIAGTLRAGKKARDRVGSDDHLSKVVELNGSYRLFFRTVKVPEVDDDGNETGEFLEDKDVAVAVVPGRSLDYEACGASFIAYTRDMYDPEGMKDKTNLQSYARIARVLHQAQCLREKKNQEAEAKRTAEELGKPIDQVKLSQALEGIELKYNGGKAADGTKINPKVSPIISGMQQKMTTQVLVVKLGPAGDPDFANARYATLELSNTRMNELISVMDKPEYFNNDLDYMEVGYDYKGTDKKDAGKSAKFQGIAKDLMLEHKFPELWESKGKKLVEGMANGKTIAEIAEIMRSRNRNLKSTHTTGEIITAVKKYCANNAAIFGSIDFESEDTKNATEDFLSSGLLDSVPTVRDKFLVLKEEMGKESGESDGSDEKTESKDTFSEQEAAASQGVQEILNAGDAAQSLQQIAAAAPNANFAGDDDLGELE